MIKEECLRKGTGLLGSLDMIQHAIELTSLKLYIPAAETALRSREIIVEVGMKKERERELSSLITEAVTELNRGLEKPAHLKLSDAMFLLHRWLFEEVVECECERR